MQLRQLSVALLAATTLLLTNEFRGAHSVLAAAPSPPRVGDHVELKLTGELGEAVGKAATGKAVPANAGFSLTLLGTVRRVGDNGEIHVNSSLPMKSPGAPDRLMTIDAVCDAKAITSRVTPQRTAVYASPSDVAKSKPAHVTTNDTKQLVAELSDLKRAKVRTWTLSEELGELPPQ